MKIFEGLEAFIWRHYEENNCNSYLIDGLIDGPLGGPLEGKKRILIDPGHAHLVRYLEASLEKMKIARSGIDVVIVTHAHPDHLEGAADFETALVGLGDEEYRWLRRLAGGRMQLPEPDFLLQEGPCEIGGESFEILLTPGHSPASICIYWTRQKALFTGDVVFRDSIGRSDLPGGSGAALKESIERLSNLDVEYLLPGHGEPISGKAAVQKNFQSVKESWFQYL